MPDLLDQLRQYGEAVERMAAEVEPATFRQTPRPRSRPNWWMAVAAAASALVLTGAVLRLIDDGDRDPTTVVVSPPTMVVPTTVPPRATIVPEDPTVRGRVTWTGGPDDRGQLRVGACPSDRQEPGCPGMQSTDVAPDGRFALALPPNIASGQWDVAAYVTVDEQDCVFYCTWQGARVGAVTPVSEAAPPADVQLTVGARVLDLYVRDRNGDPFEGGGVMVSDIRCTTGTCPPELAQSFKAASPADGRARVVVALDRTYEIAGIAQGKDWPNPRYIGTTTFWSSPAVTARGSEVDDGLVLYVDGAPGDPTG